MDFKNIKVPFLDNRKIKEKADKFRDKFWGSDIPVDIEKIIDVKLKIDIIPSPGLKNLCDTDALISSDWRSVLVDYNKYNDERYLNRLRFSYAHEMGHFVLHKDIYKSFKIKAQKDFQRFVRDISVKQYGFLETQANNFANFLLVPRERLKTERVKCITKNTEFNLDKINNKTINSYLAIPIAKIFMVSESVAEIALNEVDNDCK